MFAALARTVVRLRWPVVVVWLLAAAIVPQILPSLSGAARNENTAFLPADTPVVRAGALAAPFEHQNTASTLLVAGRPGRALTAADQAAITRAQRAVAAITAVVRDIRDRGVSGTGQVRLALVELRGGFSRASSGTTAFDAVRAAVRRVGAPPGLQLHSPVSWPNRSTRRPLRVTPGNSPRRCRSCSSSFCCSSSFGLCWRRW